MAHTQVEAAGAGTVVGGIADVENGAIAIADMRVRGVHVGAARQVVRLADGQLTRILVQRGLVAVEDGGREPLALPHGHGGAD